MKKHLLFYLVFLFLATNAWAQTNTVVTVGTATTAASGNGPIVMDVTAPTNYYSRHIAIYPAASINATPFAQRVLTKIAWYKDDTVRFVAPGSSLKIYVKQTTTTSTGGFSGANWTTEIVGAKEVLNIANPKITTGAGWKEFTLATPFIWDGTSNLEIFVDWVGVNPVTATRTWRYSTGQANASASMASNAPATSGIFVSNNLPNIQLTFNSFINDAGISAVNSPTSPTAVNVSTPVTATIKNFGDNAITTATIGWKVNGVAQPDYSWTGNLATGQTDGPKTLGNFTFPMGSHTLKVYTKTVNGGPDQLKVNDTTIVNLVACSALSGTNYTLNKNLPASATNFTSFASLAQVLNNCGISGPTTITVAANSGPYSEQFSLVNVPGTSATNTLTIEGNGNTITSNVGSAGVITLDRANYVKINNLVITQTHSATVTCYGIQLFGPSDNFTLTNSTVNMPMIFGSNFISILLGTTISASGNFSSNSLFQNNIINGGQYGMRINGTSATPTPTGAVNNRVINNQFKDFYNYGIYFGNNNGTVVEGNDFSRPTRTDASSFQGVTIGPGSVNCVISKNRFHNTNDLTTSKTSSILGVQIDATPAAGLENTVKNNVFYNLNNEGIITIFNLTGSGVNIYHNSVSIENPNRPASNTSNIRAFFASSAANTTKFVNNIVTINTPGTGNKAAIWLSSATTSFISNNNVLNIATGLTNAFTGYLTSGKATLADWRATNTTTPYDMNSVAFDPAYVGLAAGNLKPTSPDVNNIGQPTPVTDDIMGVTRNPTTPDPGAYEFDLGSLDAGIIALVSPSSPTAPGVSTPVTVTLKNFGTASLTAATIGWKVDGVAQPNFTFSGNVASNTTTPVTIGNFTFAAGNHSVCAWTTNPNGGVDINKANDSTCTAFSACLPMAGNYTINKGVAASATNFVSFTEAAARLHNCGISAKVTISVVSASGPYTEQVDLLSIPGVSVTNRVIIQGNANTLTAIPNTNKTTVLKLDNADYVKINNLNITIGGPGTANGPIVSALQLVNNSDNDTISNCTITSPFTTSPSSYFLGIFAGTPGGGIGSPDFDLAGNNTNNSVFLNNTVRGGLYGIKINGNAGGTNAVNNKVIGNTVEDCNAYGIALVNVDGNLVEGNQISRPTLTSPSTFYAIRLDGTSKNNRISKNRISKPWAGSTSTGANLNTYGIYSTGTGATIGSENIVSNNIFDDRSTPSSSYGIFNAGNNGIYYYYNTIYTSNPGVAYGFYQVTSAGNIKVFNNNISINATGAANKYALYFSTAGSIIQSNNNNLYVGSPVSAFVGYWNTDFATLANWKTANGNTYDQASVSADPMFVDIATGNFAPQSAALNNAGQPVAAVTTDILGATRSTTTPDLGAYEFVPVQNDAGVIAIVSPVTGCGLTNQETVTVTIKNFANATQTSIPVSFQVDAGAFVNETWTGSLAFGATANYTFTGKANLATQGPHTILAKTNLTGDATTTNDATTVTVNNLTQASLPKLYDFETATSGITAMRTVTRANSAITESPSASFGTGSAKGLILDGIDNANWVPQTGSSNPWAAAANPDNFAVAYICLSTAGGSATDSLWLTFDLKQLYKASNANTNFRVTVNGTQVGPTFRPPFSGTPIVWQKVKIDLNAYKNAGTIQVGLESSVKEAFANGAGTANLLDNIKFQRRIINGVKEDVLLNQVNVFPNPSNGQFNVSLPGNKTYQLEVTDLVGKTILKTKANSTAQLRLEGAAKGTYLLKISGENGAAFRKLVVE